MQRGPAFCHHGGGDKGGDGGAGAVGAVEDAEQLVRVLQVADPGVPCAVLEAVTKAREEHDDGEYRVGRMNGHDDVADQATHWGENGHAALAKVVMDEVARKSGGKIAHEGSEEEQRDDGVVDAIVCLDLAFGRAVSKHGRSSEDMPCLR